MNTRTKNTIVNLLLSTQREGMGGLIKYLEDGGFFEAPASTKYHGCYKGGLADHSLGVQTLLTGFNETLHLGCPTDSLIIAPLLHDVCKIGAYLGTTAPYTYNKENPKGHATLSLSRIAEYVQLTPLEDSMIRYHMGVYGLKEFDDAKGEYTLRGEAMANAWFHNPIVKVMYFCDELATLSEKSNEKP